MPVLRKRKPTSICQANTEISKNIRFSNAGITGKCLMKKYKVYKRRLRPPFFVQFLLHNAGCAGMLVKYFYRLFCSIRSQIITISTKKYYLCIHHEVITHTHMRSACCILFGRYGCFSIIFSFKTTDMKLTSCQRTTHFIFQPLFEVSYAYQRSIYYPSDTQPGTTFR